MVNRCFGYNSGGCSFGYGGLMGCGEVGYGRVVCCWMDNVGCIDYYMFWNFKICCGWECWDYYCKILVVLWV